MNYILYMPFVSFFGYLIFRVCIFFLNDSKNAPDIQLLRSFFYFGFGVVTYFLIDFQDPDLKKSLVYYAVAVALLNSVDAFFNYIKEKGLSTEDFVLRGFIFMLTVMYVVIPLLALWLLRYV